MIYKPLEKLDEKRYKSQTQACTTQNIHFDKRLCCAFNKSSKGLQYS